MREVDVESIAAGGDGVARVDGRVVFVPRTAPLDRVRIAMTPVRGGRFARGEVIAVERPSPDRVEPPCSHYTMDRCGGCQLQHLRYPAQLSAKGGIVRDALMRLGRREVSEVPVEPSPRQWRYRRKLTLALRRHRRQGWIAGLHRYDDPDAVFALEDCPITEEGVVAAWRDVMRAAALLPDAPALRAAVRTTTEGYAFVVEGGSRWEHAAEFRDAVPALTEIWWVNERGVRRRVGGAGHDTGEPPAIRSPDAASGASFVQVNAEVAAAVHADVVRRVMAYEPRTVIDAYAGTGATAVALADRGLRVIAIEADRDAAARCAASLPAGSRAIAGLVEDALPDALPADVVLLNPPRSGLAAAVPAALRAARPMPRGIIYVSCDPATLARDVARLVDWRIADVRAFDMFPQTAHVETVCELVPDPTPERASQPASPGAPQ